MALLHIVDKNIKIQKENVLETVIGVSISGYDGELEHTIIVREPTE